MTTKTTAIVDQLNLENTKISTLIAGMSDEEKFKFTDELASIAASRISDLVHAVIIKNNSIAKKDYNAMLEELGFDLSKIDQYNRFVEASILYGISIDKEYLNSTTVEAVDKMEANFRKAFCGFTFSLSTLKEVLAKMLNAFKENDKEKYMKLLYEHNATLITAYHLVK